MKLTPAKSPVLQLAAAQMDALDRSLTRSLKKHSLGYKGFVATGRPAMPEGATCAFVDPRYRLIYGSLVVVIGRYEHLKNVHDEGHWCDVAESAVQHLLLALRSASLAEGSRVRVLFGEYRGKEGWVRVVNERIGIEFVDGHAPYSYEAYELLPLTYLTPASAAGDPDTSPSS